jgi:hypothetical protein
LIYVHYLSHNFRFKQDLGGIISDTQKGFMKDRFMGENTRLLYDLKHYLEENDMDGLSLLVDFEKAFDSIAQQQ